MAKKDDKLKVITDKLQDKLLPVDNIAQVDSGSIFDYMKWRGDLSFKASAFNEVDNLILAYLSYVDFGDIISANSMADAINIRDVARLFFEQNDTKKYVKQMSSTRNAIFVLREAAKCERFKDLAFFSYVKDISEAEKSQFTVFAINMGNDTVYISFSGTDSTIVGWHEDFNMAYLERTAGQIKAEEYVNNLDLGPKTKLIFGGHSKGGNLAVSAALNCNQDRQKRLIRVYNNDGPGFSKEIVESKKYQKLIPKIHSVMPSGSIVGVLFDHGDEYKYIESSFVGLKEHDGLSWQVLGNEFVDVGQLTKPIAKISEEMSVWINSMNLEEREEFVENLFGVLDRAGIKTIDDFASEKLANVPIALVAEKGMKSEYKKKFTSWFKQLLK